MLQVDGAEISAVVRSPGGSLSLRVFRTAPERGPVRVTFDGAPTRGYVVDLRGRPLRRFDGETELGPWEIATLQLE
jgi:hypothetical protein